MSSSESEQSPTPEEGRPSERPSARGSTIIVDPGLIAEAERISESQRPPAAATQAAEEPEANGEIAADAEHGESANGHDNGGRDSGEDDLLTIEEAERFATAFRASWEPPSPDPAAAPRSGPSSRPAPASSSSRPINIPAEPVLERVLISELPGAQRGRAVALASAAIAGFVVLLALGWFLTSRPKTTQHAAWEEPPAEQPIQAQPPVVAKPEPAPSPAPVPVPAPEAIVPPPAEPEAIAAAPEQPAAAAPVEAAPTPAPAPEPVAAPEPEPVKEPEPVLVALQITTRPASARLTLDGSPIDNPYDAMHPQGGSHVVEATAPGYRSRNLTIDLKQKRSVALELEKAPEPKPAAAPRPKRQRSRAPKATPPASKKGAAFVEDSPY